MCPEDGVRNQGSKRMTVHVFKNDAQEIAREKKHCKTRFSRFSCRSQVAQLALELGTKFYFVYVELMCVL